MSYLAELIKNGKNVFTISIDGVPFSKRFSGHWNGQQHLHYILSEKKTAAEAIEYLNGNTPFSSLYPVEMNFYYPFLKHSIPLDCFVIENMFLTIKGSYAIDSENFSDEDWEYFSCEEESYMENGVLIKTTFSGSCDGSYYFDTESLFVIKEENDLYFETKDGTLFFKGVSRDENNKVLFKASKSFLEDFSLTEDFKLKIIKTWS